MTITEIDISDPVIRLCIEGSYAEFEKRTAYACSLYLLAWETASNDYEACIAAHYVARCQERPEDVLRWNQEALDRANAIADQQVREFYPSLYLNMGNSYERLGNLAEAQRYYQLAAERGYYHLPE